MNKVTIKGKNNKVTSIGPNNSVYVSGEGNKIEAINNSDGSEVNLFIRILRIVLAFFGF